MKNKSENSHQKRNFLVQVEMNLIKFGNEVKQSSKQNEETTYRQQKHKYEIETKIKEEVMKNKNSSEHGKIGEKIREQENNKITNEKKTHERMYKKNLNAVRLFENYFFWRIKFSKMVKCILFCFHYSYFSLF